MNVDVISLKAQNSQEIIYFEIFMTICRGGSARDLKPKAARK